LRDADEDVEVARGGAVLPGLALAGQTDTGAVLDPGRDVDRQRFLASHSSLSAAGPARLVDRLPGALAGRTGLLDRKEALLPSNPSVTVTGAAAGGARAGFGAAPLASVAMGKGGNADRRLLAAERVFERDFEIVAQIAAAGGARLRTAPAHRAEPLPEE